MLKSKCEPQSKTQKRPTRNVFSFQLKLSDILQEHIESLHYVIIITLQNLSVNLLYHAIESC
jgi:hypothetical protein